VLETAETLLEVVRAGLKEESIMVTPRAPTDAEKNYIIDCFVIENGMK